ncbi:MAG: NAD(P)/FAD-dependent oxidoreductase [Desulfobacter sp.]
MPNLWDAVVIGTGPAGLAFSATAAGLGLQVLAIDEQPSPGGQIYRNIEQQTGQGLDLLGADYRHGLGLIKKFRDSGAAYLPGATVWKIEADGRLAYSSKGRLGEIRAKRIIIATGAMERPVPFPGWTLPGVIGVGAVDTLYKGAGIIPEGPVTMLGNGPLMLSVAIHLAALGVRVAHFLETTPRFSSLGALHLLPRAVVSQPLYMLKGMGMLAKTAVIARGVKRGVTSYAAAGSDQVETVRFTCRGREHAHDTRSVLVHEGIIPRSEFARQLHLDHCWDPVQRYWYPRTDPFGRTSCDAVYVAGDGGFVHGAVAAEKKGALAAIDVASDLKGHSREVRDEAAAPVLRALKHILGPRPFVDAAYKPRTDLYAMDDNTLVCRCEEITAQQIRSAVIQGMKTPEMVKSVTRCGMGPCQSRMCSPALAELIAAETGQMMDEMTPVSIRPPVRNICVGELTRMEFTDAPGGN